jgi:hypothetical protein
MVAQKDKIKDRHGCCSTWGARGEGANSSSAASRVKWPRDAVIDGKHLRFIAPRRFAELGSIPTTKRDSIAVGVLARRSGEVINNVAMVKHVSFFETIKLRDKPTPIQKMVSTPLLIRGQPVGVAEISRKGETVRDAGPDFTPADLKKAQELFDGVAPFLAEARPADY